MIEITKGEALEILISISYIDGVAMQAEIKGDALFDVLERISDLFCKKLLDD